MAELTQEEFDSLSVVEEEEEVEPSFSEITPDEFDQIEEEPGTLETIGREIVGGLDVAKTAVTGFAGDVAGGALGLVKGATSGGEEAEKTLKGFQEAITLEPSTEEGKRNLESVGTFFNEVFDFVEENPMPILTPLMQIFRTENNPLGDFMFDVAEQTGSPTLQAFAGAFGATLAPGALEILGFKGTGRLARGAGLKKKKGLDKKALEAGARATPSSDKYLEVARGVFKEIKALGATVKAAAMPGLADNIRRGLSDSGYSPTINPNPVIEKMLARIDEGIPLTTTEIEALQKNMSKLGVPGSHERALGIAVDSDINDFLGGADVLDLPPGTSPQVAESYRVARKMYGQGKRGRTLDDITELANSPSRDYLQTIQTEYRQLIKQQIRGKGVGRFFSKADRKIMEDIVNPGKANLIFQSLAKLKMSGPNSGGLSAILSVTSAGNVFAQTGSTLAAGVALVIPYIGNISDTLAKRVVKNQAAFGNALIRAGADGRKISKFYREFTPKKLRNSDELANMLKDPNIDVSDLPKSEFTREVMQKVDLMRRNQLLTAQQAAVAAAGVADDDQ